jgi:peptidoglycan/LPS O-acetylase OafA/YrhL
MSNSRFVSQWGVYTYGLYCLHMIGILIVAKGLAKIGLNRNVYQVIFLEGGLSLLVTLLLAYVSYHLFEKRFLNLKEKFALIHTKNPDLNNYTSVGKYRTSTPKTAHDRLFARKD